MPETGFLARTATLAATTYRYQIYLPPGFTPDRLWPVILFLHGAGEGGSDGLQQTRVGLGPALRRFPERFPAVVVFPQSRRGHPWRGPMAELALHTLEQAIREFHGDPNRLYLTGVSMGGYGTWRLALEDPHRFAALVPICGGLDAPGRRTLPRNPGAASSVPEPFLEAARHLRHVPTWIFHGEEDTIIPVEESRIMVQALREVGAPVRYTEYPEVEHDSWDPAYAEQELMPWLLSHVRAP
ncbi:prolyl oligopeptidase family serine peptidase [Archangium violaceum]|uniref:carboxylesterase family protein n=1 Tax=Archangium violaceum TaxID=83451 RepID=UPI0037C00E08